MSFLRAAWLVASKDLRVELRAREVVVAMSLFAALVVLLFAFAFVKEGQTTPDAAAGILWITVALSGTLGLGRAFDREREGDTLSALLMAPVPRASIYVGKLIGIAFFMAATELVAAPLVAIFFDVPFGAHALPLAGLLALGTVGYAAVGSLFAGMLSRNRGRHVLLNILLYPIIVPVLIAGARGTQALLVLPAPDTEQVWLWVRILAMFDVAFIILSLWTFEPLMTSD